MLLACAGLPPVREDWVGYDPALFVRVVGREQPVIVAIHGGPGSGSDYLRSLESLVSHGYTVVTYDQRAVGRSTVPSVESFDLSAYNDDLEQVISWAGGRAILLGHSWGGVVALSYAVSHPHRVLGLVLLDSAAADWEERLRGNEAIALAARAAEERGLPPLPEGYPLHCSYLWSSFVAYYADPAKIRMDDLPRSCESVVREKTWDSISGYSLLQEMRSLSRSPRRCPCPRWWHSRTAGTAPSRSARRRSSACWSRS
jgi:pimeloyl-ACP methyl ester carboxylesterase